MKRYIYSILFLSVACSNQPDSSYNTQESNKFLNMTIQKLADWQDRRQTDSLVSFLMAGGEEYKEEIAIAFASIQDPQVIPELTALLVDSDNSVRKAAAYALGQLYDTTAFAPLQFRLDSEDNEDVIATILEAMGKTVPASRLAQLQGYNSESSLATTGFAYGIYRAGLRNVISGVGTRAAVHILDTAVSKEARLAAAHYLARARFGQLPSISYEVLNKTFEEPEVRMAVASAFGKAPSLVAAAGLRNLLSDEDYRVRINAVRAIPKDKINNYYTFLDSLLTDVNPNVAVATAEKILSAAATIGNSKINEWLQKKINWRAGALLLEAALVNDPSNESLIEQVKKSFLSARNPYHKASLLKAFGHSFRAHDFLITETFRAEHPVISTAGITALAEMRRSENFPAALKPAFADVLKGAVASGDPAMIDISAAVLRDPDIQYKKEITDFSFLITAKEGLKLPRENETLQSLEKTLAYFENREPKPVENEFNHPIDWEKVDRLRARHEAVIYTDKGEIKIVLFTNDAPGTVLNFVELARAGYFNNKLFHRIVPNFVVQGGGNRGDGWGGEDYSIRSELANRKYKTGSLGMASAGKDTEGTQWFITHSPTPHLDGRYTIFAQVTEGMDVVHRLEQGDKINRVRIN